MTAAARSPSATERAQLFRETCARLIGFVRVFWNVVEPAQRLIEGPHVGAVCAFLEAWRRREFARGAITMPPPLV